MAEQNDIREHLRWRHMRAMHYEGFEFHEMVKPLHALGLVECRNCKAGTPTTRLTTSGEEICTTCEDTITQFWRRNLRKIGADEAEVLQVKGGWIEAQLFIANTCRRNAVVNAEVVTERTEDITTTEVVDGQTVIKTVPVTTRTIRRERRVNVGALRLLSDVHDKLVKMTGIDLSDPDFEQPVPRKKVHVRRERDGDEQRVN